MKKLLTMTEKIFNQKTKKAAVPGDVVVADVDLVMVHDGSAPAVLDAIKYMEKKPALPPDKVIFCLDHYVPCPSQKVAHIHNNMKEFASKFATFYDEGSGICHRIMVENHVAPGMLIVGSDSHTVMYGGLSAFGTGMGSTDIAIAILYGKLWFQVPMPVKVSLTGRLKKQVSAKDFALTLVRDLTSMGGIYKALEFDGEGVNTLGMEERFTISNMSTETGAKAALFPADRKTVNWLWKHRAEKGSLFRPDRGAFYEKTIAYDLTKIVPVAAMPHDVDHVKPVSEIKDVNIDMVVIGTCTNGSLRDLEIAASYLTNHKIASNVRLVIVPSSRKVYIDSARRGVLETFSRAGALIVPPSCGPCCGALNGIPRDGEAVISTANRNYLGRMGNKKASVFLASPETAIASAIKGKITDPREL